MDRSERGNPDRFIEYLIELTKGKYQVGDLFNLMRDNNLDPSKYTDNQGYTALHHCALNSNTSLVKFLIRYVQEYFPDKADTIIKCWIDRGSNEGFTTIHLAAFRGNMVLYI